jgi:hypothetical protein
VNGERRPPLLTPAQAAALLDQVVYEQVLECVDLDALYRLEQSLTLLVGEIDGVSGDRPCDLVTAMLDRALLRLPDDLRRSLRTAGWQPPGDCTLCEEETAPANQVPARLASRRLKS